MDHHLSVREAAEVSGEQRRHDSVMQVGRESGGGNCSDGQRGTQFRLRTGLWGWQAVRKVGDFLHWGPGVRFSSFRVRLCQVGSRMEAKADMRILAGQS